MSFAQITCITYSFVPLAPIWNTNDYGDNAVERHWAGRVQTASTHREKWNRERSGTCYGASCTSQTRHNLQPFSHWASQ